MGCSRASTTRRHSMFPASSPETETASRPPVGSSISITPAGGDEAGDDDAGSGNTATAENAGGDDLGRHSSWRQRNNWLVCIPGPRATSDAPAPGARPAATIRSFSARDQRRRRCTDVITSTCAFVIGVVLVLALGLAVTNHLRKAAVTGNHTTWECKYHVVFSPKYAKNLLFVQIKRLLGTAFHEL